MPEALHSWGDTGLLIAIIWQLAELRTIVRGHGARLKKLEKGNYHELVTLTPR
jgi:hypothetical protein